MRKNRLEARILVAIALLVASVASRADGFVFDVEAPKFRISIPAFPPVTMEIHPLHAAHPHLRYLGSNGPYTISVFTPAAGAGMGARECALATLRTLVKREGVPPLSKILRTQIGPQTYMAMYATQIGGIVQLHAHYFSAAGGTHCVEVHASKGSTTPDDLEAWQTDMQKASIEPH
jgi:hypothetical protein